MKLYRNKSTNHNANSAIWDLFLTVQPLTHIWQRSFLPSWMCEATIEYWTIYREPGRLPASWFCSSPTPSHLLSRQQFVSLSHSCVSPVMLTDGRTLQRHNTEIWNIYYQKRNCAASVPISTFMCLWAIYIFPRSVCLFCCRKYENRSWEYVNFSWMWKLGLRPRSSFSGTT